MALRNAPAATAATAPGQFEEPETAAAATPAANDEPKAAAPAPAPVAAPRSTAVVTRLPTDTIWSQLQNQIPAEELEAMGVGTFPRITFGPDGAAMDKTKSLGKKVRIEIMSWNRVWLVTTGEQNNAEANKLIRSSYDGVNLAKNEGPIAEYVKYLKETHGYKKTEVKQYVELYGNLLAFQVIGDETVKMVEQPLDDLKFVQVSLSPQSVQQWQAFMLGSKMRLLKGLHDTNVVTCIGEKKTLGPNTFGYATFSTK